MWNSITSMAGGISDKSVSSAATASLYACFAVASILAPVPTNIIGARATLGLGSMGYVLYVLALLLYSKGQVGGGLVIAAGAVNGLGAGLLWTAQGALIMSYPSKDTKGLYQARSLTTTRIPTGLRMTGVRLLHHGRPTSG